MINRTRLRSSLLVIASVLFLAMPISAYAADLLLTPSTGSFPMGAPFTVDIAVDPSGAKINASDGSITFDPKVLSVVKISKEGSAFSLWTADPKFSNSAGTIDYSGGTPSGFSSQSSILTITFKPLAVGSTKVSFTKGSVLAADGKGTDVYKTGHDGNYTITPAAAAAAAAPAADAPSADLSGDPTPIAPQIISLQAPKPDSWYATSTIDFSWINTPDITGARYLLASSSQAIPSQVLKGAATSTILKGIPDGVWYFVAQLKNGSGWGPSGFLKFQIDTTPPTDFQIALIDAAAAGGVAKFSFKTTDALSGIDHYQLLFGSTSVASMNTADVADGAYPIPAQDGGPQVVTIKAFDKAGNERSATQKLTLPVVKPTVTADAPTVAGGSPWSFESVLIIAILMLIIGIQFAWNKYARKTMLADRAMILKSIAALGDKNGRVFSAMREEFEQMVNDLDDRPQLTPAERVFLEQIKEVFDISEEIVDSGVEELKNLVHG